MADQRRGVWDTDVTMRREDVALVIFPLLLYLCLRYIIPTDLFSTALWFQARGWAMVFNTTVAPDSAMVFVDSLVPGQVAVEALVFSVVLTLTQLVMTYKIAKAGEWVRGQQNVSMSLAIYRLLKGTVKPEAINWYKFGWLAFWIFCILFDSMTSVQFRVSGQEGAPTMHAGLIEVFTFSVFYENMFSEILLGESLRGTITLFMIVLASIPAGRSFIDETREKFKRTQQRPSQGGGQGQQRQPQGQQQRPSQGGGQGQQRPSQGGDRRGDPPAGRPSNAMPPGMILVSEPPAPPAVNFDRHLTEGE